MDMEFLQNNWVSIALESFQFLPVYLLQTVAFIGVIAILLFFKGTKAFSTDSYILGTALGLSSAFFTVTIVQWASPGFKALMVVDFLFIPALFGGVRNASAAIFFAILGHAVVVPFQVLPHIIFDFSGITLGSLWVRHWLSFNPAHLNFKILAGLLGGHLLVAVLPTTFLYHTVVDFFVPVLIVRRFMGTFSLSIILFAATVAFFRQAQDRENHMYRDPISKLPNRICLQEDVVEMSYAKNKISKTLLVVVLSNLTEVFQEHGPAYFYALPKIMKAALAHICADTSFRLYTPVVYHLSERSYALLLHGVSPRVVQDAGLAHQVYRELAEYLASRIEGTHPWFVIGIFALLPFHSKEPLRLVHALSFVERNTESSVQYFSANLNRHIRQETVLRQKVKEALQEGQIALWLQPKICLRTGQCTGAETLLRIPTGIGAKYFSPPLVFALATRRHLLEYMEVLIAETAITHLKALPSHLHALTLSVNISPTTLSMPGFGNKLCASLDKHNVSGSRLIIEIIETNRLNVADPVIIANFEKLRERDIRLSLDDYGTGYSSIYLLAKLPFYELKIDYSLVSSMDEPRVRTAIALSVETAHEYAAVVTAEGIETQVQWNNLLDMGVKFGQGFLFHKAMPLEHFITYASKNTLAAEQESSVGQIDNKILPILV